MENVNTDKSQPPCMKTLGVQLNVGIDMFTVELNPPYEVEYTKRDGCLKKVSTFFDPLEMLVPFTIRARVAM